MPTSAVETSGITLTGRMKAITQGVVLIQIDKALVVLTRDQFKASLKWGKAWRRWAAFNARVAKPPEEDR
jgi:hypothetical protein